MTTPKPALPESDGTLVPPAMGAHGAERFEHGWSRASVHAHAAAIEAWARADERERILNTPELRDFSKAVTLEALHQRERWGSDHDAGKAPEDWFWLLGYLGGKALHAVKTGNADKALHHTISTAAALANWHASLLGASDSMRPGINPAEHAAIRALGATQEQGA